MTKIGRLFAGMLLGCIGSFVLPGESRAGSNADDAGSNLAERTGSTFLPVLDNPYRSPRLKVIPLPDFPGANAIWGATGRDRRGHIWFGVSAEGGDHSAHLFEYDPDVDQVIDRGDVLSQLRAAGLQKPGERQIKIHSRIVPGDDGYLYFSSTDEEGERSDGSAPPKWGSHLWRLRPGQNRWEHLRWVQEGLTAVAGGGRWIYALGLWDHVLYQYDTQTKALGKVTVGSVGGHMSRNLIADLRGHVFVPRLSEGRAAPRVARKDQPDKPAAKLPSLPAGSSRIGNVRRNADGKIVLSEPAVPTGGPRASAPAPPKARSEVSVTLVEFDPTLREIGATPLDNYLDAGRPSESHGIIGLVYLADGSMVVSIHKGYLYRITPQDSGPSRIDALGHLDPLSPDYAPSLFTFAGERYLLGVTRSKRDRKHVWLVYDLESGRSRRVDFPVDGNPLIYGSITRDLAGRFYVAGRRRIPASQRFEPLLLQLDTNK